MRSTKRNRSFLSSKVYGRCGEKELEEQLRRITNSPIFNEIIAYYNDKDLDFTFTRMLREAIIPTDFVEDVDRKAEIHYRCTNARCTGIVRKPISRTLALRRLIFACMQYITFKECVKDLIREAREKKLSEIAIQQVLQPGICYFSHRIQASAPGQPPADRYLQEELNKTHSIWTVAIQRQGLTPTAKIVAPPKEKEKSLEEMFSGISAAGTVDEKKLKPEVKKIADEDPVPETEEDLLAAIEEEARSK